MYQQVLRLLVQMAYFSEMPCTLGWRGAPREGRTKNQSWNKATSSSSQEHHLSWKPAEAHSGRAGFSKDWPVGSDLTKTGICSRGQDLPSIYKALSGLLREPMAVCGLSVFIP